MWWWLKTSPFLGESQAVWCKLAQQVNWELSPPTPIATPKRDPEGLEISDTAPISHIYQALSRLTGPPRGKPRGSCKKNWTLVGRWKQERLCVEPDGLPRSALCNNLWAKEAPNDLHAVLSLCTAGFEAKRQETAQVRMGAAMVEVTIS